ncbi:putative endo-1,4-beta-xylanase [Helianthus annuus]|uniref:Putative glycoside hydrolase superfamily n=1 Tax=Helianthus annuus TaxID=4232 RepID=A0A251V600_HELAN|nr:endo-1,4-beta-xylanase 5-like isoform X2 [Helianthus annuus]KAJ0598968.1 putative endo-1,4-beta-xylanase [Helianthus annuus]KAJ0763207.1 putative endo-1,4-beta-xylanase [Helianthus annuus]KAJ0929181.1 putative endo-1,4-beta-xylanase [Helianthus annuus]
MNTLFIIFLLLLCFFFLLKSEDITRAQEDNYATEEEKEVKGFDENTLFSPYTKQEWRSYQHKKINEGRKTRLKIMITYPNKTAVTGAKLYIKQLTSDFHWGCGMTHRILNNSAYKKWFASKFTAADFHNELKWYYTEPTQGQENYTDPDAMLKFADEHGIIVRGHTVLWDDVKYQQKWVRKLSPEKLLQAANKRVDSVVTRYKGRLVGWDVMNENLHHNFFEKRLGKNASAYFYNRVHNIDPDTTLYMNEFNTTEHVNDEWAPPEKYLRRLKKIQAYPGNSGMKMGIGLECHYGAEPIDLHYVRNSLTLLSQAGLPIWLTELDVKIDPTLENKAQLQVIYLEEILRESFCHAAVKAIVIWTGASIDGCDVMCMTNEKLENTPVGDLIDRLMEEWKTGNIEVVSDSKGISRVSVFNGRYEVTVVDPVTDVSSSVTFKVDKVSIPDGNVHLQVLG